MKKPKVRYVVVDDGYDCITSEAPAGSEAEDETETEDGSDVRLECLKLAVAFSRGAKDQPAPIAVARQFLAFVLGQEQRDSG